MAKNKCKFKQVKFAPTYIGVMIIYTTSKLAGVFFCKNHESQYLIKSGLIFARLG